MLAQKKTIALVEDDILLRDQLIKILNDASDLEVLLAVSSGEEALEKIPASSPDVILLDINLPGKSGIECIRELKKKCSATEIIMLTAYEEEDNIFNALREGASGYLLKTSSPEELFDAIRDVYFGGAPFSSHIARKVAQYFRQDREVVEENESLSPREREVLSLLSSGYIYKEVADQLNITIETVRTYVKRICAKLHVRSKVEAILKFAIKVLFGMMIFHNILLPASQSPSSPERRRPGAASFYSDHTQCPPASKTRFARYGGVSGSVYERGVCKVCRVPEPAAPAIAWHWRALVWGR